MLKLNTLIQERRVLSVFDFDDTIAKSDAWVYVTRAGRIVKKLDPAQFAVYKPKPGEDFDFREFDRKIRNPRLIKQNADLLRKQLDKARRGSRGARKVTILTARRLGQPVTSFLKTMGIDAYVVPLGSADPQDKADWIESQIKKGYDTIYFMDDSNKNIAAVNNMLNKYPKIKRRSILKLIKEKVQPKKKPTKFSDYLLEQDILLEYEIFNYQKRAPDRYEFEVPIDQKTLDRLKAQGVRISTPKLRYFVTVNHSMQKHRFGQYEAEFGIQGQRHAGETINLGVKHLMSVIYTSLEVVDKMVEELKIANLKIDGAAGEKDTTGAWGGMEPTQRSNIYDRIIRKHYPSSAVKTTGRFIEIDMKKARPEIFKGQDNKVEQLIDAVMKYLNTGEGAYPRVDIERGISGTSVTNFELSTDAIIHPKYGAMYFDASVSDYDGNAGDYYEASVEYMDEIPPGSDGSEMKDFSNFQQLLNWVKSLA